MKVYLVAQPGTPCDPADILARWHEQTGQLATAFERITTHAIAPGIVAILTARPAPAPDFGARRLGVRYGEPCAIVGPALPDPPPDDLRAAMGRAVVLSGAYFGAGLSSLVRAAFVAAIFREDDPDHPPEDGDDGDDAR